MTIPLNPNLPYGWRQPPVSDLILDDTTVQMSEDTFWNLMEFSRELPEKQIPGRMWKRQYKSGLWWLMWDGEDQSKHYRTIIIVY
jgi:hypothetical protein